MNKKRETQTVNVVSEKTAVDFCAESLALASCGCSMFGHPVQYDHCESEDGRPVVTAIRIPDELGKKLALKLKRYFPSQSKKSTEEDGTQ